MKKLLMLPFVLIVPALGTGCSNTPSSDVATDAIHADIQVLADGSGQSSVIAALKVGNAASNDFVELTDGDALIAYNDTDGQTMARNEFAGEVWYQSVFAVDSAGAPFKVSFLRTHTASQQCNTVSAPDSHVTLPAPFTITAPAPGASFSRASDPITVTWSGSGEPDPMVIEASGTCINYYSLQVPTDAGTATIPAGSFQPVQGQTGTNCQVTIGISRSRAGVLDTNYGEGGSISAIQHRNLDILSTP